MFILTVNCGSSTLKFQLIEVNEQTTVPSGGRRLAGGIVDRIGGPARLDFAAESGETIRQSAVIPDHSEAARRVLAWLNALGFGSHRIAAVGHRIVHGGDRFTEPVYIDDEVIAAITAVSELAPLHNGPALAALRTMREALGPTVPMVATFDTAFHRTIPERASRYAIPYDLAIRHRIQRYGFHGLAHRYMTERYAAITGRPITQVKLVTLQLGSGCSAAAIENGRSVDTSMGFTPLEGLMMGTRSGDIDPSLVSFLMQREGVDAKQVEDWLNSRSGLLGISGRSQDMRELLAAEQQGDTRAALAIDMFCYRVRKYIGAYLAALHGAEAVVFGGGIGENAPPVRSRTCADMDWCGLALDEERNARAIGTEARISKDEARIHIYVIPVDEAAVIIRDTIYCLSS